MADTKNLKTMTQGFGVVTVINALCVPIEKINEKLSNQTWEEFCKVNTPVAIGKKIKEVGYTSGSITAGCCYLDTLKVANINIEGPSKTITGGQYANPLIKFGKTATCEMQDALGHADALNILGGVEIDSNTGNLHFTSKFGKPVAILGDTFVIDRESGDQIEVNEIIYQFLPDSIISLTQSSDGDATVFDLNGSLMATDVKKSDNELYHGMFYSIVNKLAETVDYTITVNHSDGATATTKTGTGDAGSAVTVSETGYVSGTVTLVAGTTAYSITLQKSE